MKHKLRISLELKPYIRMLLAKKEEPFRFKKEGNQYYILTNMSGNKFHNVVQRAKCMKLTYDTGLLHVTKRESEHEELMFALENEYKTTAYVVAGKKSED